MKRDKVGFVFHSHLIEASPSVKNVKSIVVNGNNLLIVDEFIILYIPNIMDYPLRNT